MSRHHPYHAEGVQGPNNNSSDGWNRRGGYGRGAGRGQFGSSTRGRARRFDGMGSPSGHGNQGSWADNRIGPDRGYNNDFGNREFEREFSAPLRGGGIGNQFNPRGTPRGRGRNMMYPNNNDSADREQTIDERIQRERPCRTLFVRNVKYETPPQEVRDKFAQMGEIKTFFDLIPNRGMAFITYFDLRVATMAKERLQGSDVAGRQIDVHYSLPKDNELERRCDRDKNQATLFLAVNGANRALDDNELHDKFGVYGDIRSIKRFRDSPHQRFVEFWDSRSCEAAYDDLVGSQYLGGTIDLKFSWDTGMVPRARLPRELREGDEGVYGDDGHNNEHYDYGGEHDNDQDRSFEDDNHRRGAFRDARDFHRRDNGYNNSAIPNSNHLSFYEPPPHASTSNSHVASGPSSHPPFENRIDVSRLDHAQRAQELLASLTQGQPSSMSSLTTSVPNRAALPSRNGYSHNIPMPSGSLQSMYPPSGTSHITSSNPYRPVSQSTSSLQPSDMIGRSSAVAANEYNRLNSILGQLPSMSVNGAASAPQSSTSINLPPAVLAILQQNNGNRDAHTTPVANRTNTVSYALAPSSSPLSHSIPTAPRAMQVPSSAIVNRPLASSLSGVVNPTTATPSPQQPINASYSNAVAESANSQPSFHELLARLQHHQGQATR